MVVSIVFLDFTEKLFVFRLCLVDYKSKALVFQLFLVDSNENHLFFLRFLVAFAWKPFVCSIVFRGHPRMSNDYACTGFARPRGRA